MDSEMMGIADEHDNYLLIDSLGRSQLTGCIDKQIHVPPKN